MARSSGTGVHVQSHDTAWFIIVFFLLGGIAFTVAIPGIWIGQIWIGVAVLLAIVFLLLGRREANWDRIKQEGIRGQARILSGGQTGTYINEQPVMNLTLRVEAPGVAPYELEKKVTVPLLAIASIGSGRPLPVYLEREKPEDIVIDWNEVVASASMPQTQAATIDLSQDPAAREGVLRALKEHGVDVAHAEAASNPGMPVADDSGAPLDRLQKLMELKNAQLITDEEFAEHKGRILKDV